jgi:hypothetical protein
MTQMPGRGTSLPHPPLPAVHLPLQALQARGARRTGHTRIPTPIPCRRSTARASGGCVLQVWVQVQVLRVQVLSAALEMELELEESARAGAGGCSHSSLIANR